MFNQDIGLFLISVFIASCAQIILKNSADMEHKNRFKEYINVRVIGAYIILFASTILTIIAYRGVELKQGPILESIGYVYILLLSWFFLKERVTLNRVIGTVLIIVGIYIFFI